MPPPIDTKLFRFDNKNAIKNIDNKEILFVGQINKAHKWKGLENLIKAFKIINYNFKDTKLIIVGDGDYIGYYKRLLNKSKIGNVIFTGRKNQEELVKFYKRCNFVVIPSISDVEGTPTVIFESMAFGKPVIGGNVGGIPYILKKEKCGIVVDAKNISEIVKSISELIINKRLYEKLSKNCINNVKKYDTNKILKEIEDFYDS
jgi:glycosyltransferase involved in cell wall biosynthesis